MNINDYININAAYDKYTPDIIKKGISKFTKLTGMGGTSKAATQSTKVSDVTTPLMKSISEFKSELDTKKDVELRNMSIKEFVNTVTGSLNNKPFTMWERVFGRSSERKQEQKDLSELRGVINSELNDNMNAQLKKDLQTFLINDAKKTFLDELFDEGLINANQYQSCDTLEKCIKLLDTILDKTGEVPRDSLGKFTRIINPIAEDNQTDESLKSFIDACNNSKAVKTSNPSPSFQYTGETL